jgi:hypothetical protein
MYTFAREQHRYEESHVFNTLKESDEYILLYKAASLLDDLANHRDRYGSLPEALRELSLPVENKLLPPAED